MTLEERYKLVSLAMEFYTNAESPSDDDWETLFLLLVRGDEEELRKFVKGG